MLKRTQKNYLNNQTKYISRHVEEMNLPVNKSNYQKVVSIRLSKQTKIICSLSIDNVRLRCLTKSGQIEELEKEEKEVEKEEKEVEKEEKEVEKEEEEEMALDQQEVILHSEEIPLSKEEKMNLQKILSKFFNDRLLQKEIKQVIKKYLITNKRGISRDKILGGGACCSRQHIEQTDINTIDFVQLDDEKRNNKEFEAEYNRCVNPGKQEECIKQEGQVSMQRNLLKKCLINNVISEDHNVAAYKHEIVDIFDMFILLEASRTKDKDKLKQEEFESFIEELEIIESYQQDFPIMELSFYLDLIKQINSHSIKYDTKFLEQAKVVNQFIIEIIRFKQNKDINILDQRISQVKLAIKAYTKDEYSILLYYVEDYILKIEYFKESFLNPPIHEDILYYIGRYLESSNKEGKQNQVVLILIKINYQLEKFMNETKTQNNKQSVYKKFCGELIKHNIDKFLEKLMQKSDLFTSQLFLIFSLEDANYRYISTSILLKINALFNEIKDSSQKIGVALQFLCNKYLTEQTYPVRILFEQNKEFVQYFNENIKSESFKRQIIHFDQERKKELQPLIGNLDNFERSINSFDDIIKMIAENANQKWEKDIRKRQKDNIAQKDDVLLEVKDLYINQTISYISGNQIFDKENIQQGIKIKGKDSIQLNAIQDILKLFLKPDYSYKLQYETQNQNKSNKKSIVDEEKSKQFELLSDRCQILGILAEGGTGKSMFMKKIEILLIDNLNKPNAENETGNYLPLMIKCNSLDSKNPSLESYLQNQGISEFQLNIIKSSDRKKLILLDGYDEYTGDYFIVHKTLKINEWKNTKVIIATRKEKLSEKDAISYFSAYNDIGQIDEMSSSLVKLEEFQRKDVDEYSERYFKQVRKENQIELVKQDLKNMFGCLENKELESVLRLPINLYLFTRMIVNMNQNEIDRLKGTISDQIGIQEMFFSDQFDREAQTFIDGSVKNIDLIKDKEFRIQLKNSYFEYFQTVAMQMFTNKNVVSQNFLQLEKSQIKFLLSQEVKKKLDSSQAIILQQRIMNYINSKIITKVKSKEELVSEQQSGKIAPSVIEFKHKSLFEYFAARAMKYDFDIHKENIWKLSINELKEFNINKKSIMNLGKNQSEQQVLVKLYKLISSQIQSEEFQNNYNKENIQDTNRYIQYLKRSKIDNNQQKSQIDIGSSNLLSALFISKFAYSNLDLSNCSFSQAYLPTIKKSPTINFAECNFQDANLRLTNLDLTTANTQNAYFDGFKKIFDSDNIYNSFTIEIGENNLVYSLSKNSYLNIFELNNDILEVKRSKQISVSKLKYLKITRHNVFISSKQHLFVLDIKTLDTLKVYRCEAEITDIYCSYDYNYQNTNNNNNNNNNSLLQDNIAISLQNYFIYIFDQDKQLKQQTQLTGQKCQVSPDHKQILVSNHSELFIYTCQAKEYTLMMTIKDSSDINQILFSENGKYLATQTLSQFKIYNVNQTYKLISTIEDQEMINEIMAFSRNGKYFASGHGYQNIKVWDEESSFSKEQKLVVETAFGVKFSRDDKYLIANDYYAFLKIFNVNNSFIELKKQIKVGNLNSLALSHDQNYLATCSNEKVCRIWDTKKGFTYLWQLEGHTKQITSIAFSKNGKYLATGSKDNTCILWDIQQQFKNIHTFNSHLNHVLSVTFSSDSKYLATSSSDKTCQIWNIQKDISLVQTLTGHTDGVNQIQFSPNNKYLASVSADKSIKIWLIADNFKLIHSIEEHTDSVNTVSFSQCSKYMATGSSDNSCRIWNAEKGFELIQIVRHTLYLNCVQFSPDSRYLATCSTDSTCAIWDIQKNFELVSKVTGHASRVKAVAFYGNNQIITGSDDATFKVWDIEKSFEMINSIYGHFSSIMSGCFTTDNNLLITGSGNEVKVWNAEKGFDVVQTIDAHTSFIVQLNISSNNNYLATCAHDHTCKIWDVSNNFHLLHTFKEEHQVNQAHFSYNGLYFAYAVTSRVVKVFTIKNNFTLIHTISDYKEQKDFDYPIVIFSKNGKYMVYQIGKRVKILNVEKKFTLHKVILRQKMSQAISFSQDDQFLITSPTFSSFAVWSVKDDFSHIKTINVHYGHICDVTFSQNGKYFITASGDSFFKIWDVQNNFSLLQTYKEDSNVYTAQFSPNNQYLLTSTDGKQSIIRVFNKLYKPKQQMIKNNENNNNQKNEKLKVQQDEEKEIKVQQTSDGVVYEEEDSEYTDEDFMSKDVQEIKDEENESNKILVEMFYL